MSRPVARPEPAPRGSSREDERTRALADTLRAALDAFPQLPPEAGRLAEQLASVLAPRLAAIYGQSDSPVATVTGEAPLAGPESSPADRILQTLGAHASGMEPGLAPEALSRLSGLPVAILGPAVSELVQTGRLVRDAWMVRLPHADDLIPSIRRSGEVQERRVAVMDPLDENQRWPGDRRAIGDRRLYDRRETS